jgi:hypothetical protein
MTQLVLPLHEIAADLGAAESAAKPLHVVTDLAGIGAASTKTSCLCVWV